MVTRSGPQQTAARAVAGNEKGAGFTVITRLRQRVIRPVINQDDSGSMLLALFAMMILTSLVTVVLMVTIAQQAKTRKATDFTFAGQAADTAVNDALMKANIGGALATSGDGVTGDFRWHWSSPTPFTPLSREITATGCRNRVTSSDCTPNSTRKIKATLSGVVYESADNSTGEVAYVLSPASSFNRALFADQDLIMQDSAALPGGSKVIGSYSSATGQTDTLFGQVATNGIADFGQNVDLDGIYMLNTQAHPNNGRCNGKPFGIVLSQCDPLRTPRLIHEIGPKLLVIDPLSPLEPQFIKTQMAACLVGGPLKAWVASQAAGLLPSGAQCYSSMNFDRTTTVAVGGTAKVYVTGPITIAPGVKINNPLGIATPAASTLQIFSSGPVVSLGGAASPTEVAWALWAPNALCASNNPTGLVTVYGAMVCQKIFTQGAFIAQWDEALLTLPPAAGTSTVWAISAYRDGS